MREKYVKLADEIIFKSRYNRWYLVDAGSRGETRFLLEKGSEDVLYFLFRGISIQEAVREFELSYKEIHGFLVGLVQEKMLEFSDFMVISTDKCYDIEPPLDSLGALITNACNLRCAYCCLDSGNSMEGELDEKLWINVFQQARQLGVFRLNISGGEPLLHNDFYKIVEYIASVPTFNANLNTNGAILPDGCENILAEAFTTIQVSIDDAVAEKHNTSRGCVDCFGKSIRTIRRLVDCGVETNVGFLLNSRNLSAVDGVVDLCERIGVNVLNIGFINSVGRAKTNSSACPITPQSLQKDGLLDRMYRKFCEVMDRDTNVKILLPFPVKSDNTASLRDKQYVCGGDDIQFVSVMADGVVMPCDILPAHIFGCGNVKTQPLIDIWTSDKMKAFKLMNPMRLPACSNCFHFPVCGGPCLARAFQTGGTLESPDLVKCLMMQKVDIKSNKVV